MALHSTLTGADLHESKGVDSASANTVYVANGAGSGTWQKVPAAAVDTLSIKNMNREQLFTAFIDIGTAGSRYQAFTRACTLTKVNLVLQAATAGAATVLTFRNDAGTSMGTLNVPNGTAAGTVLSFTPVGNNTFLADQKLQIESDGGTSTNSNASFTLDLLWT